MSGDLVITTCTEALFVNLLAAFSFQFQVLLSLSRAFSRPNRKEIMEILKLHTSRTKDPSKHNRMASNDKLKLAFQFLIDVLMDTSNHTLQDETKG